MEGDFSLIFNRVLPLQGPARLVLLKLFKFLFAKDLRLMNPGLRGGGQWVAPALSPSPECLAAQSDRAEHPRVQDEPPAASPHPAAGQELGSPWSFPMSHMGSSPWAQSTGRGHAQRRGLSSHIFIPASPGHRHHRHQRAAQEGDAPSCSPPPHPPLLRELEASVV